ncbi:MAG: phosphoesterase, partial [Acetobacteraceae bacterium]|nr:phosphoesterase [Acetobacteraceae bacterium]
MAARQAAEPRYPNDPNLLPGTNNVAAPDGPQGQAQQGYLWNAAFRAGLSVRNYGFFEDLGRYNSGDAAQIPPVRDPAASGTVVAYSSNPDLAPVTDPYFRGFDNAFPDLYREQEWEREFNRYVADGNLPNLELVRLMHDHLGNFAQAIDGINTP